MNEYVILGVVLLVVILLVYASRYEKIPGRFANYHVRAYPDKGKAVILLEHLNITCIEVIRYMRAHHPRDPRTLRLLEQYNIDNLAENIPLTKNSLTSYTKNKGDEISICLRRRDGQFHDLNTLKFVMLHELSHVATDPAYASHGPEFWSNFKFIIINAVEAGVYQPIDYSKANTRYCGLVITHNPYYDPNM